VISKNYFEDHHAFSENELLEVLRKDKSDSLLETYKDFVKIENYNLPLSLLDLSMEVDERVFEAIGNYIAKEN